MVRLLIAEYNMQQGTVNYPFGAFSPSRILNANNVKNMQSVQLPGSHTNQPV